MKVPRRDKILHCSSAGFCPVSVPSSSRYLVILSLIPLLAPGALAVEGDWHTDADAALAAAAKAKTPVLAVAMDHG